MNDRMKKRRNEKGYSREKVSELTGITADTYGRYETGTRIPPVDVLCKIADALECDIDYLLGFIPEATHKISDINKETGLSEKACKRLNAYIDNSRVHNILNWLIENGLLFILDNAYNRLYELQKQECQYKGLPKEIKLKALTGYNSLKKSENTYFFNWLQSQDTDKLLDIILDNCHAEIDADSAQWYIEYCLEHDIPVSGLDDSSLRVYSMTTKIIDDYMNHEKQEKLTMYEIWDSYLDLIKQYRKEDSFIKSFEEYESIIRK